MTFTSHFQPGASRRNTPVRGSMRAAIARTLAADGLHVIVHAHSRPENAARVAALLAGDVDIATELPVHMVKQIESSRNAQVMKVRGTRSFFVSLNNTKPPFDNINARKCFAHAFNYMGFINDIRKIVARLPADRQTLLFSATLPGEILRMATEMLRQPKFVQVGQRGALGSGRQPLGADGEDIGTAHRQLGSRQRWVDRAERPAESSEAGLRVVNRRRCAFERARGSGEARSGIGVP